MFSLTLAILIASEPIHDNNNFSSVIVTLLVQRDS